MRQAIIVNPRGIIAHGTAGRTERVRVLLSDLQAQERDFIPAGREESLTLYQEARVVRLPRRLAYCWSANRAAPKDMGTSEGGGMTLRELHEELGRLLASGESPDTEILLDLPGEGVTTYSDGGIQVQVSPSGAREIVLFGHSYVGEETEEEEA